MHRYVKTGSPGYSPISLPNASRKDLLIRMLVIAGDVRQNMVKKNSTEREKGGHEIICCPLCGKFMGEWKVVGYVSLLKKCPRCGKLVEIIKTSQ